MAAASLGFQVPADLLAASVERLDCHHGSTGMGPNLRRDEQKTPWSCSKRNGPDGKPFRNNGAAVKCKGCNLGKGWCNAKPIHRAPGIAPIKRSKEEEDRRAKILKKQQIELKEAAAEMEELKKQEATKEKLKEPKGNT